MELLRMGAKSMVTFSVMADDRAALRALLATDLVNPAAAGIVLAAAKEARVIIASVLAAWVVSSQRMADEIRLGSDSRAFRLPPILQRPVLIGLRAKFESTSGRINDNIWPCAALIEKRLEEAEEGSFTATPLSEAVCVERGDDEILDVGFGLHNQGSQDGESAAPAEHH